MRSGDVSNTFDIEDPARGIVFAKAVEASEQDVEDAVRCAKEGQLEWASWSTAGRARVLQRAATILKDNADHFARLETLDTARPYTETLFGDIPSATDCIEFMGGLAVNALNGSQVPLGSGSWGYTVRSPLGVCAGIGAWNYPLQSAVWKSAPALAAGNSIIFKPAPQTPLTALELGRVYDEAGVPKGCYNVLLGKETVGKMLSTHDDIAKVSFTGSVNTGKRVYADAAQSLKRVTMELGGKSPLIIFGDANLDDAVSAAMMANWYSNGEVCSNGTRVYVEETLKEKFMALLLKRTQRLVIGDPMDTGTEIGAMISRQHMETVRGYVETGIAEGAQIVNPGGGEFVRPENEEFRNGYYMTPAIFDDCKDDMTIVREEIFGMVMCVLTFSDEDDVVHRANDSEYGLSAGLFTNDLTRAHRVANSLEAGTMWVNNYNLAPIELPWAGHKSSGLGQENGSACLAQWTKEKSIYMEMGKIDCSYE
eukprot:g609.t1